MPKNTRKSLRRRMKRKHSTILWDPVHQRLYVVDIPRNGQSRITGKKRKGTHKKHKVGKASFLLRYADRAEMALNMLKSGRPHVNEQEAHRK